MNAGCGDRDLCLYIQGRLENQDIPGGLHNRDVDIYSPLDRIPRPASYYDAVVCNAVLEHVPDPHAVMAEFHRVLKPSGYLYLCIPFLQPEHLDPGDYPRYTKYGLKRLAEQHGFEVVRLTLAWIVHEWFSSRNPLLFRIFRAITYPWLRVATRRSRFQVDTIASAYRILAQKNDSVRLPPCR